MTVVTSWLSRGLVTFELPPGSGAYEQEHKAIATATHHAQVNAFVILVFIILFLQIRCVAVP